MPHNDTPQCAVRWPAVLARALVLVETIYSVLGDAAPVVDLAEVCAGYDALLVADEAHALGVAGVGGAAVAHCRYCRPSQGGRHPVPEQVARCPGRAVLSHRWSGSTRLTESKAVHHHAARARLSLLRRVLGGPGRRRRRAGAGRRVNEPAARPRRRAGSVRLTAPWCCGADAGLLHALAAVEKAAGSEDAEGAPARRRHLTGSPGSGSPPTRSSPTSTSPAKWPRNCRTRGQRRLVTGTDTA